MSGTPVFRSRSARSRSGRKRGASCSRSSRRTPVARCSRSAAPAGTPRSGWPLRRASSAAASCRWSRTRARSRHGAQNIADAGLEEWAELVEGDALEMLAALEDGFDIVFIDAWKDDYEAYFELARTKLEPGGVVVADNVDDERRRPRVRRCAAGRSDPRVGDRPDRPRPGGHDRPALTVRRERDAQDRYSDSAPLDRRLQRGQLPTAPTSAAAPASPTLEPLVPRDGSARTCRRPTCVRRLGVPRKGGGRVSDSCSTGSGGASG